MEAVLLSSTPTYIQDKISEGSKTAILLGKLKSNIDRPLSAILSINTVAHTVGAAGVGAQATAVFGEAYFGIISGILTLLILFLSEIIPKTIGATYWRHIVLPSSRIIQFMIWTALPLVWISEGVTRLISKDNAQSAISRKEVAVMANIGLTQGVLEESESKIINNLLRLRSIKVKSIMTPRTVTITANEEMELGEFFKKKEYMSFSRIPVYQNEVDNIKGYVLKYDVLENIANDKFDVKLKDIARPVTMVYENIAVPDFFNQLLEKKEHMAIIFDEFGVIAGIATIEDVIETLLGLEIIDETDQEIDMQKLAKERWERKAKWLNVG